MGIITIQGQIASGGEQLGPEVAKRLGADYVDRFILAEAGKRLGATVEALEEQEQRVPTLRKLLIHYFQRTMEGSAHMDSVNDSIFGMGFDALRTGPYTEEPTDAMGAWEIDDAIFFRAIAM